VVITDESIGVSKLLGVPARMPPKSIYAYETDRHRHTYIITHLHIYKQIDIHTRMSTYINYIHSYVYSKSNIQA